MRSRQAACLFKELKYCLTDPETCLQLTEFIRIDSAIFIYFSADQWNATGLFADSCNHNSLQADASGTIVDFIAENKSSVAPGQVDFLAFTPFVAMRVDAFALASTCFEI